MEGRRWTVHVRPAARGGASYVFSRVALWGLSAALILSFLLFYFLLAEKNAELEKVNRMTAEQVRAATEVNKRLLRANRELDDFTYVVSHDLKEPLRGVEGLSRLLLEEYGDKLDDTAREYLDSIRGSGKRMRRLVADLLRLSRSTRKQYPYVMVGFNELVSEVLETLQYSTTQKGARIEVQPNLPSVLSDRVRIMELFQNLVSNAIKFNESRPPVVKIGHRENATEHLFWVSDNGVGIPPDGRERIFQIFRRLHGDESVDGTGVGLTICKRIVERHGGRIWVEEATEGGSRFCFTLPKQPLSAHASTERPDRSPADGAAEHGDGNGRQEDITARG